MRSLTSTSLLLLTGTALASTAPAATAAPAPAGDERTCVVLDATQRAKVASGRVKGTVRVSLRGKACVAGDVLTVTGSTAALFTGRGRPSRLQLAHVVSVAGRDAVVEAHPSSFRPTIDGRGASSRVVSVRARTVGLTVGRSRPIRFDGAASRVVVSSTAVVRTSRRPVTVIARDVARLAGAEAPGGGDGAVPGVEPGGPGGPGGEAPGGGETPGGTAPVDGGQAPGGTAPVDGGQAPGGTAPVDGGQVPGGTPPVDGGQAPGGTPPVDGGDTPGGQPPAGGGETSPPEQGPPAQAPNQAPIAKTVLYRLHWGVQHNRFMAAADSDGSIVRYEITHRSFSAATYGFSADARTGQFFIKGRGLREDLTMTFRALDDRGAWSSPATITIHLRNPADL